MVCFEAPRQGTCCLLMGFCAVGHPEGPGSWEMDREVGEDSMDGPMLP